MAWALAALMLIGANTQPRAQAPTTVFPGREWQRLEDIKAAGYNPARLDALRAWLKTGHTSGLHVAVGGKTLFEYDELSRVSKVASVRKSILALLYGKYVASGMINLDKTVAEIGLDDVQSFLDIEKQATLRHLLTARSGIYLPSGNEQLTSLSPRRGSQAPGTYFQYQNWDFNAAGAAFEKLTGQDIFAALETDIARPIGMQDYDRRRQKKHSALPDSRFPEYAMYLSTRDMARVGLLTLRNCRWQDTQVEPENWCRLMTTLVTPLVNVKSGLCGAGRLRTSLIVTAGRRRISATKSAPDIASVYQLRAGLGSPPGPRPSE